MFEKESGNLTSGLISQMAFQDFLGKAEVFLLGLAGMVCINSVREWDYLEVWPCGSRCVTVGVGLSPSS